jgi:hypothetical protein
MFKSWSTHGGPPDRLRFGAAALGSSLPNASPLAALMC